MITTSEFLRKAADVLERDGWCQGHYRAATGERCAAGALGGAENVMAGESVGIDELDEVFGFSLVVLQKRLSGKDLAQWNDTPGRTKEEVLALFRNTADELEVGDAAERIANERKEMVS